MKRRIFLSLVAAILTTAALPAGAQSTPTPTTNTPAYVFVTPSGKKFHLYEDCRSIRNSNVRKVTYADGSKGRDLCQICARKAGKNAGR
jgi:hypothetical protein